MKVESFNTPINPNNNDLIVMMDSHAHYRHCHDHCHDYTTDLPVEVWVRVICYLDCRSVVTLSACSLTLNSVVNSDLANWDYWHQDYW